MNFGERLAGLLREQHLTQCKVARDLNIANSTLNGYIKGPRQPDYATLVRIAVYFDVSVDYLLGRSNVRKGPEQMEDKKEGELIGLYRCLQPEKQELLLEQAQLYRRYDRKEQERRKGRRPCRTQEEKKSVNEGSNVRKYS